MHVRHLGRSGQQISEITDGTSLTHGPQVENTAIADVLEAATSDPALVARPTATRRSV